MLSTPDMIRARLKQLGVGPDKYLGQHFLIDPDVLQTIVGVTKELLHEDDMLVEVGPGLGVLTQALVGLNRPVIAIEKDPVFAQALPSVITNNHLTVTQGDVLALLDSEPQFPFAKQEKGDHNWLFVANIPYAITSPLLCKLINLVVPPRHIIVLMQKEVAERLIAPPGSSDRGLLTIALELVGQTKIVQFVPPHSFWPEPKVESALVAIDLRHPKLGLSDDERKRFFRVVTAGFSQKRKQLANSLAGGLALKPEATRALLISAQIDPLRRAETLTLDEWFRLSQCYESFSKQ